MLSSVTACGREKNEWLQKGISPEKEFADQEPLFLDQIDHAKTSEERDERYFRLALQALSKDDAKLAVMRARWKLAGSQTGTSLGWRFWSD